MLLGSKLPLQYFHIIGDGHQPNSRGLYTHYKDSRHFPGGMSKLPKDLSRVGKTRSLIL